MDFSKIIDTAMKQTVQNMPNLKPNPKLDEEMQDIVHQNKLLQDYSHNLLRSYHEELKKELAKQGIEIQ